MTKESTMGKITVLILLGLSAAAYASSNVQRRGSVITFTASPMNIKTNVTTALSMGCGLSDTDTQRDVAHVTQILVSKHEGSVDVAQVSAFEAPMALTDLGNLQVKGDVSSSHGYLELTWQVPSLAEATEYWCQIETIDAHHHRRQFKAVLTLTRDALSIEDLVVFYQQQNQEFKALREKDTAQAAKNSALEAKISSLEQQNALQAEQITNLKQCEATSVAFMAAFSNKSPTVIKGGDVVIYDKPITNVGDRYNVKTGVFTATTAGVYAFTVTSFTFDNGKHSTFNLQVNDDYVATAFTYNDLGETRDTGVTRAVVRLAGGDMVRVVAIATGFSTHTLDEIWNFSTNINIFSGELLKADSCLS